MPGLGKQPRRAGSEKTALVRVPIGKHSAVGCGGAHPQGDGVCLAVRAQDLGLEAQECLGLGWARATLRVGKQAPKEAWTSRD